MFDLTEVLRLEVDVPGKLDNLIKNPNGERGPWFWKAVSAGHAVSSDATDIKVGTRLRLQGPNNTSQAATTAQSGLMRVENGGGKYVTFRMNVLGMTNGTKVRTWFAFYDASKGFIAFDFGAAYVNNLASSYTSNTVQLPAGAEYVLVTIDVRPIVGGFLPANTFIEFNQTRFGWADTAGEFVGVVATNLLTNPSLETNTTNWFQDGFAAPLSRTTGSAFVGTYKGVISKTFTTVSIISEYVPVEPGKEHTVSIYVRLAAAFAGVDTFVKTEWADSAHVPIGESSSAHSNLTTAYQRYHKTDTAPADAAFVRLVLSANTIDSSNQTIWFDAAMINEGGLISYFDGGTADGGGVVYDWVGTANASASTKALSTFEYREPGNWYNLFADGSFLTVDRASLTDGRLNATIESESFIGSDILRSGRGIRLIAYAESKWNELFVGSINDWKTINSEEIVRVQIIATDPLDEIQAYPWTGGIGQLIHTAFFMEEYFNGLMPWIINGLRQHYTSTPAPVSRGIASNMLDHFRLVRDNTAAFMFISRDGTFITDSTLVRPKGFSYFTDGTDVWRDMPIITQQKDGTSWSSNTAFPPGGNGVGAYRMKSHGAYSLTGGRYRYTVTTAFNGYAGFDLRGDPEEASYSFNFYTQDATSSDRYIIGGDFVSSRTANDPIVILYSAYDINEVRIGAPVEVVVRPNTVAGQVYHFETEIGGNLPEGTRGISLAIVQKANFAVADYVEFDNLIWEVVAGHPMHYARGMEISEDSARVGNMLDITWVSYDPVGDTSETKQLGPYTSQSSVARYGKRKMEFTVQGISEASVPAWAADTLEHTEFTEPIPGQLKIYITKPEDVILALTDLESRVPFFYRGEDYGDFAIKSIKHEIGLGGQWVITFDFDKAEYLSRPLKTNK